MYRTKLTTAAQRQLDNIPGKDLARIVAALRQLGETPRSPGVKKLRDSIYRIRLGDWRVIYAVMDRENVVVVGKIVRRSEDTYDKVERLF